MADHTANYNLKKPSNEDFYDIQDFNGNVDIIDRELKNLDDSKVEKLEGKQLSTNDFTNGEKDKLREIEASADVNTIEGLEVNGTLLLPDIDKILHLSVADATQVIDSLDSDLTTSALSAAQGKVLKELYDKHVAKTINSEEGAHGLRYYQDVLSYANGQGDWVEIKTGGGIAPSNIVDKTVRCGNGKITVFWEDPSDTVVQGQTICTWKGTKLVQKEGSYPENVRDGVVLVDAQVHNQHKTNGFLVSGLENGVTYYFALFPYSDGNAVNENAENRISGVPQPYSKMTVNIDYTNSDPFTCVTYADDAEGMIPGSPAWDDFFGHYPVLFSGGSEVGRLNTSDFARFEDGAPADITSGNAGDVMIAFPRLGLNIVTVGDVLTISMTDRPDAAGYEYLAHTRGSSRREKFYLGAYKGYNLSSRMRSLSGKTPTSAQLRGTCRAQAQANGSGYENSGFYQLIYRQAMYVLKYKSLNSQATVGMGYVEGNSGVTTTGGTNTKGMDFGESTGAQQMKLFGIEDFWGNICEWIDGIHIAPGNPIPLLTATTGFNDTGSGYMQSGTHVWDGKYMPLTVEGNTKLGFFKKTGTNFSGETYFCDGASISSNSVSYYGGNWNSSSSAGVFNMTNSESPDTPAAQFKYVSARLMYL